MRHLPAVLLTTAFLGGLVPLVAQEGDKAASPEEIADRAMKAMDAMLNKAPEPAGSSKSPKKNTPRSAKSNQATSPESKDGDQDEEDSSAAPSILPATTGLAARGMDPMTRSRMDMMVPTGRSHRGVHYPVYRPVEPDRNAEADPVHGGVAGVTAPLLSLFESEVVTRLDEDHVQFDRAKWVQFDEALQPDGKPRPTMSLEIERGVYDLRNEILMTNQPVKIENDQFLITGDTMLHDRASGLTRLSGRVHMTFYNEEPAAASAADSGASTNPIEGESGSPIPAAPSVPKTPATAAKQ